MDVCNGIYTCIQSTHSIIITAHDMGERAQPHNNNNGDGVESNWTFRSFSCNTHKCTSRIWASSIQNLRWKVQQTGNMCCRCVCVHYHGSRPVSMHFSKCLIGLSGERERVTLYATAGNIVGVFMFLLLWVCRGSHSRSRLVWSACFLDTHFNSLYPIEPLQTALTRIQRIAIHVARKCSQRKQ